MKLSSSLGFGQAILFHGDANHPPRLRIGSNFLFEDSLPLTVVTGDATDNYVAYIRMGEYAICSVRNNAAGGWQYDFSSKVELTGDRSLLLAQLAALVSETLETVNNHNPRDYAGTIPLGV